MTAHVLFALPIEVDGDVVISRRRARHVARVLGMVAQDQVRISTAVSEVVRNALFYAGGGRIAFRLLDDDAEQTLVIEIADNGPGIGNLSEIFSGSYRSKTGLGLGLIGAKRLLDEVDIETAVGVGTTVRLVKHLLAGHRVDPDRLPDLVDEIRRATPSDVFSELREQNRELIEIGGRLEQKHFQLQMLNRTLEERIEQAVKARLEAEDRLRQSQKLEAIGQLTGGISHDFNNMLAAIGSGVRLLESRLAKGDTNVGHYVDEIKDALRRASALTQRLMAFARHEPIAPETLSLNPVVDGMRDLLTRTLGHGIVLEFDLAPELPPIHVDASELENVLLNLCVNSRDAMPQGGCLRVETRLHANPHGSNAAVVGATEPVWVSLSVSDTGMGMPPDVLEKALVPFFTTKVAGQGTGLGLAQVFGFAKQSGGSVRLSSEVGKGTRVDLRLLAASS